MHSSTRRHHKIYMLLWYAYCILSRIRFIIWFFHMFTLLLLWSGFLHNPFAISGSNNNTIWMRVYNALIVIDALQWVRVFNKSIELIYSPRHTHRHINTAFLEWRDAHNSIVACHAIPIRIESYLNMSSHFHSILLPCWYDIARKLAMPKSYMWIWI